MNKAREILLLRIAQEAARQAIAGGPDAAIGIIDALAVALEHVPDHRLDQVEREIWTKLDSRK